MIRLIQTPLFTTVQYVRYTLIGLIIIRMRELHTGLTENLDNLPQLGEACLWQIGEVGGLKGLESCCIHFTKPSGEQQVGRGQIREIYCMHMQTICTCKLYAYTYKTTVYVLTFGVESNGHSSKGSIQLANIQIVSEWI